ncbi:MAG: hypothetical protein WBR26_00765 [Candidatus Acidiferrum sp.]
MAIEFLQRSDVIEECYEFLLGYAAQGLPSDEGSSAGHQVREHLERAREAINGLSESCKRAIADQRLEPSANYEAFCTVLEHDARDSEAAIALVLAQPALSSQLIDNLNASSHLRALLTDLFLLGEILRTRTQVTALANEK